MVSIDLQKKARENPNIKMSCTARNDRVAYTDETIRVARYLNSLNILRYWIRQIHENSMINPNSSDSAYFEFPGVKAQIR
jgi:hypothetical protein